MEYIGRLFNAKPTTISVPISQYGQPLDLLQPNSKTPVVNQVKPQESVRDDSFNTSLPTKENQPVTTSLMTEVSLNDISKSFAIDFTKPLYQQLPDPYTKFKSMFNEALNVKEAGISGVFGAIAGYTVKKFTRSISIAVGTGVVTASALSRSDLIRVNWNKVEDMLVKYGDIDGDGLVTKSDFNLIAKRLTEKAASKFPSLTSTITSFVIGYRLG